MLKEHFHPKLAIQEVNEDAHIMFGDELFDFEDNESDNDFVKHVLGTFIVGKKVWSCFKANWLQRIPYIWTMSYNDEFDD